jgi:hypothetical protein
MRSGRIKKGGLICRFMRQSMSYVMSNHYYVEWRNGASATPTAVSRRLRLYVSAKRNATAPPAKPQQIDYHKFSVPYHTVFSIQKHAKMFFNMCLPAVAIPEHLEFYSRRFLTFGIPYQDTSMTANSPIAIGWRTNVPTAWAKMPVVKGATAPPLLPKAEMTPRPEICEDRGIVRVNTAAAQG